MGVLSDMGRRVRQLRYLINPPPELRRRHPRYAIDLPVLVHVNGADLKQTVANASDGGMLLVPGFEAAPEAQVEVTVTGLISHAPARVVAVRSDGTAIRFEREAHGALITIWLLDSSEMARH